MGDIHGSPGDVSMISRADMAFELSGKQCRGIMRFMKAPKSSRKSRRDLLKLAGGSLAAGIMGCVERPSPTGGTPGEDVCIPARKVGSDVLPLLAVDGTAYECGFQYGRLVVEKYPGYRRYLDQALDWRAMIPSARRLFEQHAPCMLDVYRGLLDATRLAGAAPASRSACPGSPNLRSACSSFGLSGRVTLHGQPISGQTKDTVAESAALYIVLRMRIKDGPKILVLAYPGEVLGYGFWSTGMSIFRNSLFCREGEMKGLPMEQWGLLALAGKTVDGAVELAQRHGISTTGNFLISDASGKSVSVESNTGGVEVIHAHDGIAVHANTPCGSTTAPLEHHPLPIKLKDSRYRMDRLRELLEAERGRLTAQRAMMCLADHSHYPWGLCRHPAEAEPGFCTTAAVVVEPTLGLLHVTRGNPCSNWPATYAL